MAALISSAALPACESADNIPSVLQNIQSIIATTDSDSAAHYELSYDSNFPCSITLQENWKDAETRWHQIYRFDLSDIEKNTFIQSKAGRRAIIYSGYKQVESEDKKVFREVQINNLDFRGKLTKEKQSEILREMNTAIAMCEEKYSF